jgi:flagellar basal body-associated protein FliL
MNRHKILFVVAYVLMPVLLAWIGYLAFNYDSTNTDKVVETSAYTSSPSGIMAFYDLPQVSLSLSSGAGLTGTFKLDISLEVMRKDLGRVVDYEPRIIDRIVSYMHRQSVEDLHQPDSAKQLRVGLEQEINRGAIPIHIASVYVRTMVFE